jgi:hypothetical protein
MPGVFVARSRPVITYACRERRRINFGDAAASAFTTNANSCAASEPQQIIVAGFDHQQRQPEAGSIITSVRFRSRHVQNSYALRD